MSPVATNRNHPRGRHRLPKVGPLLTTSLRLGGQRAGMQCGATLVQRPMPVKGTSGKPFDGSRRLTRAGGRFGGQWRKGESNCTVFSPLEPRSPTSSKQSVQIATFLFKFDLKLMLALLQR